MNEHILTQLKVLVERAVRPVRASMSHKRRMREELLGHVCGVLEEELAALGGEQAALKRTAERFGNPAELTRQLQDAVPASDGFVRFSETIFVRLEEPPLRCAVRLAALMFLVPGALLLAAFFLQGRLREWPIIMVAPVLAFFGVLLVHWQRRALFGATGRSLWKAALVAAASCLLVPTVTFGLCLVFSGDVRSSLAAALPLLPIALLTPIPLVSAAWALDMELRAHAEWANLQIH